MTKVFRLLLPYLIILTLPLGWRVIHSHWNSTLLTRRLKNRSYYAFTTAKLQALVIQPEGKNVNTHST
jgi:hypothetical protein